MGLSFEALHETLSAPDRLRHLGLRRRPERPGPYRDKKAYDLLIQSESGFLSITGTPDEPAKAGCSIADIAAGMYAYSSILAALIAARQDRQGLAHRRLDAREHGRVDELPALLRLRRRRAAAARRRRARDDLSLRPVPRRRRQDGDARPAERARVGRLLRAACSRSRRSRPIRASPPTPRAPRRARRCARSSSTSSRR